MSFARAIEWQKASARAEAMLSREQRAKIARARAERLLLTKFDPDQPRDEGGKWTSGGGDGGGNGAAPTAFVSPSVSAQTFAQAVQSLGSKEQARLKQFSEFVDGKLGIQSENRPAIGAWADGAENSMMVVARGATTEQMRAACAMKGYLADQKSVLMFDPSPTGTSFMASFDVAGKPEDLHAKLLQDGLAFHTLEPRGGDAIRVHVYGSDQDTINAVEKAAGNSRVHFVKGSGEFLGTSKDTGSDREQRDDARRVYEQTIKQIADSGPVGGRDLGKVWGEARDYWQSISSKALTSWRAKKKEPWQEQPRVPGGSPEGGQFGSGGGGGGGLGGGGKPLPAAPAPATSPKPAAGKPSAAAKPAPAPEKPQRGGAKAPGADKRVSTAIPSPAQAKKQGIEPHKQQNLEPNYAAFNQALNSQKGTKENPQTGEREPFYPYRQGIKQLMERYGETGTEDKKGAPGYPAFLRLPENATEEQAADALVGHLKSNLVALYKAQDPAIRERAKEWYTGANKIANDWAKEYGVSAEQVAAVIACTSPQRDWDQNVDIAKRMLDTVVRDKDVPFTGDDVAKIDTVIGAYRELTLEKLAAAKEAGTKVTIQNAQNTLKTLDELSETYEGKTLSQLPDRLQPFMARFATMAKDPSERGYQIWNPEGTPSGKLERNDPTPAQERAGEEGTPSRIGWGSFSQLGNVISALNDGSRENLSGLLGENHKVRNFYNNIVSPEFGKDTTIDTHAVAASMLMPLGQSSPLVKEGLGMTGPSNAETGIAGIYALHYEAYRAAAEAISNEEKREVFPREIQSIVWETVRGLYSSTERSNEEIRNASRNIWSRYQKGEIELEQAQAEVLAKGIRPPRWA